MLSMQWLHVLLPPCLHPSPCRVAPMPRLAPRQEKSLRVYSRNASKQYASAVHEAFESWLRSRYGSQVSTSTPCKPPRPPPPADLQQRAAAAAGLAQEGGGGLPGGKRTRGLFAGGSSDDDTSPSNLMKTKQRRSVGDAAAAAGQ